MNKPEDTRKPFKQVLRADKMALASLVRVSALTSANSWFCLHSYPRSVKI